MFSILIRQRYSLILSNTLPNFLLVFWLETHAFMFPISFGKILSFGFLHVNCERDAYLAVDYSLVYSYPKMFLIFFSLILSGILPSTHPACKSCFSIFESQ